MEITFKFSGKEAQSLGELLNPLILDVLTKAQNKNEKLLSRDCLVSAPEIGEASVAKWRVWAEEEGHLSYLGEIPLWYSEEDFISEFLHAMPKEGETGKFRFRQINEKQEEVGPEFYRVIRGDHISLRSRRNPSPSSWTNPLDENAPEYLRASGAKVPTPPTVSWASPIPLKTAAMMREMTGCSEVEGQRQRIVNGTVTLNPQLVEFLNSVGISSFLRSFGLESLAPRLTDLVDKFQKMPVFANMADQMVKEPHDVQEEPEDPNIVHGRTVWRELIDQWRKGFGDETVEQPDRLKLLSRTLNVDGKSVLRYLQRFGPVDPENGVWPFGLTQATREALATLDNVDPEDDELKIQARVLAENINAVASLRAPGLSKFMEYDRPNAALPGREYEIG